MTKQMWPENERSTRNCFHAKVKGNRVLCAKGHQFSDKPDGGRSVRQVISRKSLWGPCDRCPDLDIDWY